MRGTLKKKNDSWVVEYWYERVSTHAAHPNLVELPLHPDDIFNQGLQSDTRSLGKEVEFEIIEKYVEPDDNIHCNRGADIKFAKLISKQEELPNESFNMLMKGSEQESWDEIETMLKSYISFSDLFEIMQEIKKKYNPPTKK